MAVRQALLLHQGQMRIAQLPERAGNGHIAGTVERAVDDGDILAGFLSEKHGLRLHRLQKGRENGVRDKLYPSFPQAGVKISPFDAVKEIQLFDFGENFRGGFNGHLQPSAP